MAAGIHGPATTVFAVDPDSQRSRVVLIESRRVQVPTGIRSFVLPDGRTTPTDLPVLIVRITDDVGAQGFSLLWFQQAHQAKLVGTAIRASARGMSGLHLSDLPEIDRAIRGATAFLGAQGVNAFAASGLRMAVEDLICRRSTVSMADALGRRRSRVRAYQTGLMLHATVDELVEEAAAVRARGMRAIKMIVGKPTLDEDADRIQAVRESMPADTSLMVDALQRWTSVDDATRAAERFADFGLLWIEDPLAHDDVGGYSVLAQRSPVPIATGEAAFTRAEFETLLDTGIGYVVGEPERVGGFRNWMDVAEAARRAGATMLPHLYPHVSAQMLGALPQDEVWLEYVPWFDALVVDQLRLDTDGAIEVNSAPGSGFTPHPDALERLAREPWRRLDR